jgi:DNA-binding MarR family transcriptional regulator
MNAASFLAMWATYQTAKEMTAQAKAHNSSEQTAAVMPMFSAEFPELAEHGYTCFSLFDDEETENKVVKRLTDSGAEKIADSIAEKNIPNIDACGLKKMAEHTVLNAALDLLEQEAQDRLSAEEKRVFRDAVNAKGYSRARNQLLDFMAKFVKK